MYFVSAKTVWSYVPAGGRSLMDLVQRSLRRKASETHRRVQAILFVSPAGIQELITRMLWIWGGEIAADRARTTPTPSGTSEPRLRSLCDTTRLHARDRGERSLRRFERETQDRTYGPRRRPQG